MRRLSVVFVIVSLLTAGTAHAQLAVIDPAQIAELVRIVFKVEETIRKLEEMQTTLSRMRTGLPGLSRYRLRGVPIGSYNTARYPYAADILAGMNTGNDPDGNGWQRTVQRLQPPLAVFGNLSPEAWQTLAAAYATVEIEDSTAVMGQWTAGQTRTYSGQLQTRIDRLQDDVINGVSEPTALLDKLAVAGSIRSRQQMAATQLQSAVVDQMIAQAKARRDAEVEVLNATLSSLRDNGRSSGAALAGTEQILRQWSLP